MLAKLVSYGGERPSTAQVDDDLALSPSQVHSSLKRLARSRFVEDQIGRPLLKPVEEFRLLAPLPDEPFFVGSCTLGCSPQVSRHAVPFPLSASRRP